MLAAVGAGLWEAVAPLRIFGFELGHRMTVVRLPGGEVATHSPIQFSPALADAVREVAGGDDRVKWIIAPSVMHDLFLAEWADGFSSARLFHSPGMKIKGVKPARLAVLAGATSADFGGALEPIAVGGMPKINEYVFFHPPSRSLIVADLVFNLAPGRGVQKWLQKMNGIYERCGPSLFFRQFISHEAGFRQSLLEILARDFDQILVGHGHNVKNGGPAALRQGFNWLLEREPK